MRILSTVIRDLALYVAALAACGAQSTPPPSTPPSAPFGPVAEATEVLADAEIAAMTSLAIMTIYPYGGLGPPCECDDGGYGQGGQTIALAPDGNRLLWAGCWRSSPQSDDPNQSTRCHTFRQELTIIEPARWLLTKRQILGLALQSLEPEYNCDNKTISCLSDSAQLTHAIRVNERLITIKWPGGMDAYLPPKLQRLNAILGGLAPGPHD